MGDRTGFDAPELCCPDSGAELRLVLDWPFGRLGFVL
jgi:hypothetical protein